MTDKIMPDNRTEMTRAIIGGFDCDEVRLKNADGSPAKTFYGVGLPPVGKNTPALGAVYKLLDSGIRRAGAPVCGHDFLNASRPAVGGSRTFPVIIDYNSTIAGGESNPPHLNQAQLGVRRALG